MVNQADVDYLVRNILGTRHGDANLDQKVNFTDFQVLLDHWAKAGAWATGDFTGDGLVNFSDFQCLLDYWNPSGYGTEVPEPASMTILTLGGLAILKCRRR